ncbi:uncharacterized protein LOC126109383 [Schistocerca cancellata]|uniref:uncharacterized protein LOC126109383 n=1 Tax=Schistocerca cancellata TaxID=274614 RepID=UPI00211890FA|nr:uncharacterized protein LOC126109383 [Schistocerca cancellata]
MLLPSVAAVLQLPMMSTSLPAPPAGAVDGTTGFVAPAPPVEQLSAAQQQQAAAVAAELERRRIERERRRQEKERRRQEKEKRRQRKLMARASAAADTNIKKALLERQRISEGLVGTIVGEGEVDIEEMKLLEEAMQEVPEMDDEAGGGEDASATPSPGSRKRRKTSSVLLEVKPLPPAGRGILVSPGFRDKPLKTAMADRKSVKFADGVQPGEGTSPSGGEDLPSPPPPPRKLPKEKRFKKKKKKKKVKVKIIRHLNVEEVVEEDDDEDDDSSPPPPPPGSPPPPPAYPYPAYLAAGYAYPYAVVPGVEAPSAASVIGNADRTIAGGASAAVAPRTPSPTTVYSSAAVAVAASTAYRPASVPPATP